MSGIQYNISISQKASIDADIDENIDLIDLSILDMLLKFSQWDGCKKMNDDGKIYYLFNWNLIPNRLPRARISSRSGCKSRFTKLSIAELISPHPDNKTMSQSWFCWGEKYAEYNNLNTVHQKTRTVHQSKTQSTKKTRTVHQKTRSPSEMVDTMIVLNDSTNDDISEKLPPASYKNASDYIQINAHKIRDAVGRNAYLVLVDYVNANPEFLDLGKFGVLIKWFSARMEQERPVRGREAVKGWVKLFQTKPIKELRKEVEVSARAGYPNLFYQNKSKTTKGSKQEETFKAPVRRYDNDNVDMDDIKFNGEWMMKQAEAQRDKILAKLDAKQKKNIKK